MARSKWITEPEVGRDDPDEGSDVIVVVSLMQFHSTRTVLLFNARILFSECRA